MPARIPDRYLLEMRLGRDGDIEEWLAADTSLDRPVLIRALGPDTDTARRNQFVESVSAAAKAHHPHLAKVYVVELVEGGAYSVLEWTGGSSIADRIGASYGIELDDFLPNAAGLAGALAALHEAGAVHGSVDLTAISYSETRAAKLGAFGRPFSGDAESDVRSLSAALETALTGEPPGGPPPSESIDGISPAIDRVLRSGQSGAYDAAQLEKAFLAAPTPRTPRPEPRSFSRRLLIAAGGLVVLAVGLVGLGALFGTPTSPILPGTTTTLSTIAPTSTTEPPAPGDPVIAGISTHDPFGGGGENDDLVGLAIDGDLSTVWQTEGYLDPLPSIKPGVGLVVTVVGSPSQIQLSGFTRGAAFEIRWSPQVSDNPSQWERIAAGTSPAGTTSIELPPRADGFWLLWLTDLPESANGDYSAGLAELRLLP